VTARCTAITKSGHACRVPPQNGRPFCLCHDPETQQLRKEAAKKGGLGRSTVVRAQKLLPPAPNEDELAAVMADLLRKVIAGTTDVKIVQAAAIAVRVIIEARRVAAQPSVEALSERIDELRTAIDRRAELVA